MYIVDLELVITKNLTWVRIECYDHDVSACHFLQAFHLFYYSGMPQLDSIEHTQCNDTIIQTVDRVDTIEIPHIIDFRI